MSSKKLIWCCEMFHMTYGQSPASYSIIWFGLVNFIIPEGLFVALLEVKKHQEICSAF